MKHLVSLLILLTACSIGSAQGFNVDQYRVQIFLSVDSYFDVIEDYDLDFYEEKHGIFRDIITDYQFQDQNGKVKKVSIEITNIDVPDHKFSAPSKFNQRIFGGDTSNKLPRGEPTRY